MDNNSLLPNNSHKYKDIQLQKEENKKIERVTHGEVKFKKKSSVRQFFDQFIQEDGEKIKSYVLGEVLIPSIKRAITEIITNSVNILFYGDARSHKKNIADSISYTPYNNSFYQPATQQRHTAFMYENICYNSYSEATDVLDRMFEILDTYGVVSVSDLNQLVGISGNYTDNNYGWTNLNRNNSYIRGGRDGFELNLPRPTPIDNN